jgi:hypothetical protein
MLFQNYQIKKYLVPVFSVCLIFITLISGCSFPLSIISEQDTQENYPQAEVIFKVTLLQALPENTSLALEIVDDVTGLAFNPQRFELTQQDSVNYFVKLPLVIGSVLKYRYVRVSDMNTIEYSLQGNQIRFRLAKITGPAIFQDNVVAWIDQPYIGPIGRARGQFIDQENNAPIPNLLVTAEGVQTVTASDGTFILEGLTPGTHNLVVYSMDGQFSGFQQGVLISEEATTPVYVYLNKQPMINVTFTVNTPTDFDELMPVRFASNMQSLGNLYSDSYSGSTTIASNLPVMTKEKPGKYTITLDLPKGFDLRYKYSLGDGLWNSELTSDGNFVLRELLVGATQNKIVNTVDTFRSPNLEPINFTVNTPQITPKDDLISVQFNPFGWFEPIPMVKIGELQWSYTLYSPLHLLGPVEYRFCRNELCEKTAAIASSPQVFIPAATPQGISVNIEQWSNLGVFSDSEILTDGGTIAPKTNFLTGFELVSAYSPTSQIFLDSGFRKISENASNTVIIPSTWSATRNNPPYLEPLPGIDYSWSEMQTTIIRARQQGLQVFLFPQVSFPNDNAADYWLAAKRDEGWWITWYENYHRYMMQVADWAALNSVDGIVLGDPFVSPSSNGGKLANGKSSGAPANADEQWRQLILDVRSRFSGAIIGVYSYPNSEKLSLGWLDSVDQLYVLYSSPLAQDSAATVNDLMAIIKNDLDNNLYTTIKGYGKNVILGINYPSAVNAFVGCTDTLGNCLNDWGVLQTDLNVQSRIYNAAIIEAGKESWINGFISRNYEPVAAVQDSSASINGKPAFDVLWFWYHFILNISP